VDLEADETLAGGSDSERTRLSAGFESPLGIAGPEGLDPKVAAKLHDAFRATLDDKEVQRVLADFEFVPSYQPGAEFLKSLMQSRDEERKLFARTGLLRPDLK